MLDGIRLSRDPTAVMAIGIDSKGRKHVFDFALGSCENQEVSRELMSRIVKRGFTCDHRLFVVLDGSNPLRALWKCYISPIRERLGGGRKR